MESIYKHRQYLESYHIRPSVQRLAVIDYLWKNNTHPTVEQIYEALIDTIPTLSKTTVYNILNLFVEVGLVQELTIDEKQCRYDGKIYPHAHVYCKHCGDVFDVPMPIMQEEQALSENFDIHCTHVYYVGLCKKCKSK